MGQLLEFAIRHPLLVGATLIAFAAVVFYELRHRSRASTAVSPQEAVRMINDGATVVDLREAGAFGARHIVNATNMTAADLSADPEHRLKKKRAAILVCDTGYHSARSASALRKAGFDQVFSLDGGLAAWAKENLPMVSGRAKS
jgi:rhodanese-related sulfurtransferase